MTTTEEKPRRKARDARHIGTVLRTALAPLMKGRRGEYFDLFSHWQDIVGPSPYQLDSVQFTREGTVLTLRAHGGDALQLQHQVPYLLERINRYLGREAVIRIKIKQGV